MLGLSRDIPEYITNKFECLTLLSMWLSKFTHSHLQIYCWH